MVNEVRFVMDSRDSWKHVDLIVTDHPDIITSKPEGKGCVIVDKEFNRDFEGDFRINSIKELSDILDLP
jgi:hypothetical protein